MNLATREFIRGKNLRMAFTLLEVMIAAALFFMAVFSMLALVSTNIRNARYLQKEQVDAGMLLADQVQTNILTYGADSGDFGNLYPGYTWNSDTEVAPGMTNGFAIVQYVVTRPGGGPNSQTTYTAWLYRPDTPNPQ
jgi:Tfp pilus assembly protein PilV